MPLAAGRADNNRGWAVAAERISEETLVGGVDIEHCHSTAPATHKTQRCCVDELGGQFSAGAEPDARIAAHGRALVHNWERRNTVRRILRLESLENAGAHGPVLRDVSMLPTSPLARGHRPPGVTRVMPRMAPSFSC